MAHHTLTDSVFLATGAKRFLGLKGRYPIQTALHLLALGPGPSPSHAIA